MPRFISNLLLLLLFFPTIMLAQTFGPIKGASSPNDTFHQSGPTQDSLLESTSVRISLGLSLGSDNQVLPQGVLCYQPNPKKPGIRLGYKRAGDLPFAVSGAAPNGVLDVSGGFFIDANEEIVNYTSSTGGFDVAFVYEGVTDFYEFFDSYPTGSVDAFYTGENISSETVTEMLELLGGNDAWFSTSFLTVGIQSPIFKGVGVFVDYLILPTSGAIEAAFTNPNLESISEARRFNPTSTHKPMVFDLGVNLISGRLSLEAGTRIQLFTPPNAEVMIQAGNIAKVYEFSSFQAGSPITVYGDGSYLYPNLQDSELVPQHYFEDNGGLYSSSNLENEFGYMAVNVLPTYKYDSPSLRLYPFVNLTYILF